MTPQQLEKLLKDNPHVRVVPSTQAPIGKKSVGTQSLPASRPNAHSEPETNPEDEWTKTEKKFAREILQPRVDSGYYIWFMPQAVIYMPGQRYTIDFVAAKWDGTVDYFEVKGSYKLLGEDRSTVKLKWLTSHLQSKHGHAHKVFKAAWRSKRKQPIKWHIDEIKLKTAVHPLAKD